MAGTPLHSDVWNSQPHRQIPAQTSSTFLIFRYTKMRLLHLLCIPHLKKPSPLSPWMAFLSSSLHPAGLPVAKTLLGLRLEVCPLIHLEQQRAPPRHRFSLCLTPPKIMLLSCPAVRNFWILGLIAELVYPLLSFL